MQLSPFITLKYKIIDLFHQITLLSFTFKYQSSNKMENKFMFSILLTFYLATITQCYQVQLQDPFPMTNNLTSISHIAKVPSGWLVAFQNKQMRSYTANLSLLSAWSTLQIMGKIQYSSFSLINFTLSNGSRLNVFHQMITTTSKDCQTLRGILWPSFTPISMVSLSQKILAQTSIPIPTSQRPITMSIIISNQSIKQYYKQSVNTLHNFTNQFGLGAFGVSANLWKTSFAYQIDSINISFIFYIGISNNLTKQIVVLVQMEYDYSSLDFALVASAVTAKNILTADSMITKMIIANDFLVLQSNSTGSVYLYNCLQQVQGSISANFPKNQIFDIINNGNQFYLLSSKSFSKISLSTSNYLSFTAIINSLAANNYRFVKGSLFDIFYIVGASRIYKAGLCIDKNKLFNGTDCDSYNCLDNNCDDCPITRQTCSICQSGLKKSDYFRCSSSTPPSITIAYPFNQTYSLNSTSSNSSSANNQSYINSTNINTNQTNNINASNTSNNSLDNGPQQFDNFLEDSPILSIIERFLQLLISVPTARCTLKPIFYLFGTFDDLYLYSFHDRKYGNAIKTLFLHINTLENAKWTLISKIDAINYEPSTFVKVLTQSKSVYLTYNYKQSDLNNGSQGLLKNCYNFFLFSLPVTIAFFSIFRIIYLLFHKRISILQNFSQWTLIGFLILTFFDGNVQQFAFFAGAQFKKLFFFNIRDKLNNTITILFSFSLILVSVGGYLIGYLIYKQHNNKLIENNKNIFDGNILLLLQNGFRNLLLGFIHSFCRLFDNYFTLLGLLLCIQILFFTIFVKYVTPHNFIKVTKMWMYLLLTFIRILIIFTLFFDYQAINIQIMQEVQQNLIFCMINVYISSVIIFLAETIYKIILSIIKIAKGNQNKTKSQSKKKSAISMLIKIQNNINNRPIQTAGIQTAINQKQEIQTQTINIKEINFENRVYKKIKSFKTIFITYGKKQDLKKSLSLN